MKTNSTTIGYWGKLPSVNHMYGRGKFWNVYLKPEAKALKDEVILKNRAQLPKDQEMGYTLTVYGNWYNKESKAKTRIKKRDSNNLVKLIVDACCEACGIDDSQIFLEIVVKSQSEREGFRMVIGLLDDNKG